MPSHAGPVAPVAVDPVRCRIGLGRLEPAVEDLLLLLEADRRQQAVPLDVSPGLAVDHEPGIDRGDAVRTDLGGGERPSAMLVTILSPAHRPE